MSQYLQFSVKRNAMFFYVPTLIILSCNLTYSVETENQVEDG